MPAEPARAEPAGVPPARALPAPPAPTRTPGSPRGRGLIAQLFVVTILPLTVLLLVIAFGSVALHQSAMRQMVGQRDERAVRSAAATLGEELRHRALAVQGLALRAADGTLPEDVLASAGYLLPEFDGGLAFFTPDGRPLAATAGGEWTGGAASRAALADVLARAAAGPAFSQAFPVSTSGTTYEMLVAFAAGTGQPVAVGAFAPGRLTEQVFADTFAAGAPATVMLVAPGGDLIYQAGTLDAGVEPASHAGVREALAGRSGTTYVQSNGSEHVAAYSPVAPAGWALIIEEPWEAVASPLLSTTLAAPLVLVPALLLALVALWFGARQIVGPLQALDARAGELAWGRYRAVEEPVGGIAEIRHLQTTLVHLSQKVRAAQQGLRGYIGAITAGQEEERRRLARELHDETLQALIALNQRVQLAELTLQDHPAQLALQEIGQLTEHTIADLRRLMRALRPIYLDDLGLVTALEMLARETSQSAGIPVDFRLTGEPSRLSPQIEVALYRIAQEGLNNVTRHAEAHRAALSLAFAPGNVRLALEDDGRGFSPPESPAEFAPHGHFGLLGLHERAELIGAQLAIQSAPGEGTRLTVELPVAGMSGPAEETADERR